MKTIFLSNTNLDPVVKKCSAFPDEAALQQGFDTWRQTLERLPVFSCVFLIIDGFALHEKIRSIDMDHFVRESFTALKAAAELNPGAFFFVSDIDVPDHEISAENTPSGANRLERLWAQELSALCSSACNVHTFDMKQWVADAGRSQVYSPKLWYLGGIRYSLCGQKILLKRIEETLNACSGRRKKCLVLDADNTLWGGVIGEDGIGGIVLAPTGEGARFYHFQQTIAQIASTGIICAIVSKNNQADLRAALAHPHMLLKEDFFVSIHASWNSKADELMALSGELNLGLDSFVFIDDSPSERALIQETLPDVAVPDFPADTAELPSFIFDVYNRYFHTLALTSDDRNKAELYKTAAYRADGMNRSPGLESFLKGLKIRITAERLSTSGVPRFVQLCQKTNQFNLTTKRYTDADVLRMLADPSFMLYLFSAEDRFGSYGAVAAAIVCKDDNLFCIDSFLLSCRAMGKNMEYGILGWILEECAAEGAEGVKGEFISTPKNDPAKDFYSSAGFVFRDGTFFSKLPVGSSEKFYGEVTAR
jgi:FkbH-like protein